MINMHSNKVMNLKNHIVKFEVLAMFLILFAVIIFVATPTSYLTFALPRYELGVEIELNGFVTDKYDVYLDLDDNKTEDFYLKLVYSNGQYVANVAAGIYYIYIFSEGSRVYDIIELEMNEFRVYKLKLYDFGQGITNELPVDFWGMGSANILWYVQDPSASEFHISTGADLAGMASIINAGVSTLFYDNEGFLSTSGNFISLNSKESFSGDIIYLAEDIYIGAHSWQPIGTTENVFEGSLDGQENTIYGLYIENAFSEYSLGLFLSNAGNIENLRADKGYICGNEYVGAFAGGSSGKISKCINNGVNIKADTHSGGIVGILSSSGIVERSSNYACVSAELYSGGIAGRVNVNAYVRDTSNAGMVISEGFTGGITGNNFGLIDECVNDGEISGSVKTGGIVGVNTGSGSIINSYNLSIVRGVIYVGGIAGEHLSNGVLNNSYNMGDIYATGNSGGIAGGIDSYVKNCFNGGLVQAGDDIGDESGDYIQNCYFISELETLPGHDGKKNAFSLSGGFLCVNVVSQYLINSLVMTEDDTVKLSSALNEWVGNEGEDYVSWKEVDSYPVFLVKHEISFSLSEGWTYSLLPGGSLRVREGSSFSFSVQLLPGYSQSLFSVYANESLIFRESGVYRVLSVDENTVISVDDLIVNEYAVKFVSGNEVLSEKYDYHYGDIPEEPSSSPVKESDEHQTFVFAGWDKEILPISSDITYYAVFDSYIRYYTVSFLSEGTLLTEKTDYIYGDDLEILEDPVKEADQTYVYQFVDWDKELTKVYENRVYNAVYNLTYIDYFVRFISDGNIVSEVLDAHYGDIVVYPEMPLKGSDNTFTYEFFGWDKPSSTVYCDITYYAYFTNVYIDYIITFLSEEEIVSSLQYHFGDIVIEPPAPEKQEDNIYAYVFLGWNPQVMVVEGHKTYTAIFNSLFKEYNIVFVNGEVEVASLIYNYGDQVIIPDNPEREPDNEYYYIFKEWSPEVAEALSSITYVAVFEIEFREYTVVFKRDDIVVSRRVNYHYGDNIIYPDPISKPSDGSYTYEFVSWDSSVETVSEDMVINAVFSPNPTVISSNPNNGSTVKIEAFRAEGFSQGTMIMGRIVLESITDFNSLVQPGERLLSIYNASLYRGNTLLIGQLASFSVVLGLPELPEGSSVKVIVLEAGQMVPYYTEVLNGQIIFNMSGTGDFAVILEAEFVEYAEISPWVLILTLLGIALILVCEYFFIRRRLNKKKN